MSKWDRTRLEGRDSSVADAQPGRMESGAAFVRLCGDEKSLAVAIK